MKRVTEDIEQLHYNTAIAALMELVNALREPTPARDRALVEELVVMLAPFAPHFAEECWERLGHTASIFDASWPDVGRGADGGGRGRGGGAGRAGRRGRRSRVPRDAEEKSVVAAAMRDVGVRRFTEGKEVRKVVYVKNRLLNLVVG